MREDSSTGKISPELYIGKDWIRKLPFFSQYEITDSVNDLISLEIQARPQEIGDKWTS